MRDEHNENDSIHFRLWIHHINSSVCQVYFEESLFLRKSSKGRPTVKKSLKLRFACGSPCIKTINSKVGQGEDDKIFRKSPILVKSTLLGVTRRGWEGLSRGSTLLSKSMEEDNIHSTPIMQKLINNPELPEEKIVILKELESLHSLWKEHFLENNPQEEKEIRETKIKAEIALAKTKIAQRWRTGKIFTQDLQMGKQFILQLQRTLKKLLLKNNEDISAESIVQINVRSLINKFKGDPEDEKCPSTISNWKTAWEKSCYRYERNAGFRGSHTIPEIKGMCRRTSAVISVCVCILLSVGIP
ncbi:unnamed protein product [Lepeophtheirus salmonis]|uniref:(salmon louse) hypothetical protein n=1 Tax=Lepeophtheirus salmonis TaxID=72036 RepID=A0A7R8CH25_LEPSM|nr:unnamed protein product [Lepeophtheirus salmonis]CAF2820513.1 unnamed protein product [Lepeophtheirus salmonis]